MASIKIKRGQSFNLPSLTLEQGEPAFCVDTGKLYIGNGTEKILINPTGGTATQADKLTNARNFKLQGDVQSTTVEFDGTQDVTLDVTIASLLADKILETSTKKFMTLDERNKLATIEANAEENQNAISSVIVNGDTIVATTKEDHVEFIEGTNISLTADVIGKTVTVSTKGLGTASSKNVGTSVGNVPEILSNGKIDSSIIPAIAITDTYPVDSEVAMLALDVQIGDIAIRTDIQKSFILKNDDATILSSWQELLSPTDVIQSVNGKTGVVILTKADVGLGNVDNESKTTMFTSPTFTGTPRATTPLTDDDSTAIATTEFVKAQGYLVSTSTIDGGVF